MAEINFVKPRLTLIDWMTEIKQQVQRLGYYDSNEMRVYRNMRKTLYRRACKAVKESHFLRHYNKDLNSTKMRYIRNETVEILTYLCLQEMQIDSEFELYRRGSKQYRRQVEEKWLNNVAQIG